MDRLSGDVSSAGADDETDKICHVLRGAKAAEWDQKLKPADDHWDKRIVAKTPLKEAGLYLVKATVAKGNTGDGSCSWAMMASMASTTSGCSSATFVDSDGSKCRS